MCNITQPFRMWISFHPEMKGLVASISRRLNPFARTNPTLRTDVVHGKKLDTIVFRRTQYLLSNLAKANVHLVQPWDPIQEFNLFESKGKRELLSFSILCIFPPVSLQLLLWWKYEYEMYIRSKRRYWKGSKSILNTVVCPSQEAYVKWIRNSCNKSGDVWSLWKPVNSRNRSRYEYFRIGMAYFSVGNEPGVVEIE